MSLLSGCRALTPRHPLTPGGRARLTPAEIAPAERLLGPGPVAWALETAAEDLAEVVAFFADPDLPVREVGLSIQALLLDLLVTVATNEPSAVSGTRIPPMARGAARRAVPFASVMLSMRAVQQRWLGLLLASEGLARLSTAEVQSVLAVSTRVFDDQVSRFISVYPAERERVLESTVERRRMAIEGVLAGKRSDLDQLRIDLGVDLEQQHLSLVLSAHRSSLGSNLAHVVKAVADQLNASSTLLLPVGRDRLWAWLSAPSFARPVSSLDWQQLKGPAEVRCCVGQPAAGLTGFRQSHLQAADVEALTSRPRIADTAVRGTAAEVFGLHRWEDHPLTTLLLQNVERAEWFVAQVLGSLAQPGPLADEQRSTLLAYLECGQSLVRAASLLHVHRNTVVYRLRRIEEALGAPLGERATDLHCALILAQRLAIGVPAS